MYVKIPVKVYVYTEMFYEWTGSDGGVANGDCVVAKIFEKRSAKNKDNVF